MNVTVFLCGVAVNESETGAIEHLKRQLQSTSGNDQWILLTNLAFSVTHQFQSDEIDIIAIGPPGVRVIEVKHWSAGWIDAHPDLVEQEADKVTNKARKIGTTLRRIIPDLPRVDGAILLTQPASKLKKHAGRAVRGVTLHTLNQWKDAIQFGGPQVLSSAQITSASRDLAPKSAVAVDGSLRRLAGYVNLELQSPRDERFHRVYRGHHPARRDRVVLHLYDLSASDDGQAAEKKAKREFEALHRLQFHAWAPRILDSWQDAPGYSGEMHFFTIVDPAAPCIEDRAEDFAWDASSRIAFARDAIRALGEFHQSGDAENLLVHRNLTPRTILVRHDNSPILTGLDRARIPSELSVASSSPVQSSHPESVAPEIRAEGLSAADQRSDVYSLCWSLCGLLTKPSDGLSAGALEILTLGAAETPAERPTLDELDRSLSELLGDSLPPPPAPPSRFWTEDQIVRFRDSDYRIITRLGSGGVGVTFKVVELDRDTKEELGTYVAKVAHEAETGQRILKAYSLARSHLGRHEALSAIYEFAREWRENDFVSLLTWIEGTPLSEFTGVFPLLAEDQQDVPAEALAIRWLTLICEALDVLHRNGLIHGDVSPRNLIVSGSNLALTDYDFVCRLGEPTVAPGTVMYCSPASRAREPASPSDDLYALAASFFHVVFDREPFRYGADIRKDRGLNWEGIDRSQYSVLAAVLDTATHSDPKQRFASATDFRKSLRREAQTKEEPDGTAATSEVSIDHGNAATTSDRTALSEQRVEWLRSLLQSYPGSRWGNRETRGLDSGFAKDTYVPTPLEDSLLDDIRNRRVRLVILCGNAGDGKTALLQHLAQELGLGRHTSSERILKGRVANGSNVQMNLDGSAAWKGKSADEILDEFLKPFQQGPPTEDIVHLLAINDGRLLEWIGGVAGRLDVDETPLTTSLYQLLHREATPAPPHIRFISLNERSLVGGINADRSHIETGFLERLVDQLYGGDLANEIWSPCRLCSAQDRCRVFQAARVFGPGELADSATRKRARTRLFEALQAVHLRGEKHITVRELRATLVFVLFGIHYCDDYHNGDDEPLPYWDRAFDAESPARQGEVLPELARFDPAMEAHPQIDRYLLNPPALDSQTTAPHYFGLKLASARRRAFFEWNTDDAVQVAADADALDLARGRHLRLFRSLPLEHDPAKLAEVCQRLCGGISRLEDLPPQALKRLGVVPLRITPRTPTETAFWVEKPVENFRLEPVLPPKTDGIERLHRQVALIYRYQDGNEERLLLGAELFHLLLELADGYQLGDVSTDDTFAHLSIFVQRLVREGERHLLAWNPMRDEQLYRVEAVVHETSGNSQQKLEISTISSEVTS